MIQAIHVLGDVAAYGAAASALIFCVAYHLTAPWWRSPEGRHLMSVTALLGVVFTWLSYRLTVAYRPLGMPDEIVRATVYWLVMLCLLWRLWLLYQAQVSHLFVKGDKPEMPDPEKQADAIDPAS